MLALVGMILGGLWATRAISDQRHDRELKATAQARTDVPHTSPDGTLLPSGWVLHPAGRQISTGDMPVSMTVSPGGEWVLVSTIGYSPCQVLAIDVANEQVQTTQTLDQTWQGLAFGPSLEQPGRSEGARAGTALYVSGGGRGFLWRFHWDERGGDMIPQGSLPVDNLIGREAPYVRPKTAKANAWIAGIATDPNTGTLYVLNNQQRTVYALDPQTGKARARAMTGDHPNAITLSENHKRLYVTNQGSASVSVFEIGAKEGTTDLSLTKVADVSVGQQPVALLLEHPHTTAKSETSEATDSKTTETRGTERLLRRFATMHVFL